MVFGIREYVKIPYKSEICIISCKQIIKHLNTIKCRLAAYFIPNLVHHREHLSTVLNYTGFLSGRVVMWDLITTITQLVLLGFNRFDYFSITKNNNKTTRIAKYRANIFHTTIQKYLPIPRRRVTK